MSSKKSLVWTIWKRTKGFWETYLRGRRIMRWVIGSREERTIFPRQAWHRGRQELSSQMAKWRLLCCYFNSCSLHVKGYLDRWCASMSGHALPKKDPTSTRTAAQVAQLSAGQDEDTCWDCHLKGLDNLSNTTDERKRGEKNFKLTTSKMKKIGQ